MLEPRGRNAITPSDKRSYLLRPRKITMTETQPEEPASEFGSWTDVVSWLLSKSVGSEWIYRGHSQEEFHLTSKLYRSLSQAGVPSGEWIGRESRAISYFRELAKSELRETPADEDLIGWLSLMQHYGAPTRLLDWTVSPFVACYFAYAGNQGDQHAALWVLNAKLCREFFGSYTPTGRDYTGTVQEQTFKDGKLVHEQPASLRVKWAFLENTHLRECIEKRIRVPLPMFADTPDKRMLAQQAAFTAQGDLSTPIDAIASTSQADLVQEQSKIAMKGRWIGSSSSAIALVSRRLLIRKVVLRREWKSEALTTLARMNITSASLFPGLDGIGGATALALQLSQPLTLRQMLRL